MSTLSDDEIYEKANNNENIFYDPTGTPYYVDEASGKVYPIKNTLKEAMKTPTGKWNKAIRAQARALYFQDYSLTAISAETKVPLSTISKWVYGREEDKSDPKCFYNQKKRVLEELVAQNEARVHSVNQGVLKKMEEYVAAEGVRITNVQEFKAFAESFSKMNSVVDKGKDTTAQQTNIYMQPYSVEESRSILESDPILTLTANSDEDED